jgi:hypothetical protein
MDMVIRVSLVFHMSKRDEAVVIGNPDRGLGIAMPDFIRELAAHSELLRSNRETHLARSLRPSGKSQCSRKARSGYLKRVLSETKRREKTEYIY